MCINLSAKFWERKPTHDFVCQGSPTGDLHHFNAKSNFWGIQNHQNRKITRPLPGYELSEAPHSSIQATRIGVGAANTNHLAEKTTQGGPQEGTWPLCISHAIVLVGEKRYHGDKPFLSDTTPSPSKFNSNVTWGVLAPMDEKRQTPNITFANMCAETLRFGGAGVQHSVCCRVWIFCPSTVDLPITLA